MPLPQRFSAGESHEARAMAESFGTDPVRYDRTRPSYPAAMVEQILAAAPGLDFLDVGIGTGICARPFRAAGCRVLGVEADPRMAEFARSQGFEVDVARFEEWQPEGRAFDAVIAGQTWHWVDPVHGAQRAAEALRPGGLLAIFWNVFQLPPEVAQGIADAYERALPGSPFARGIAGGMAAYSAQFAKAEEGIGETKAFAAPERSLFEWERSYTREEWLDQVPTSGGHNLLEPEQLAKLLEGIGAAIQDTFTMRYTTVLIAAPSRTG